MAWQMPSLYQALQLVDITLPSVFFKCLYLASQAKKIFFYTITIPTINSCFCFYIFLLYIHQSLVSNKSLLLFFFLTDANSSSAGVLVNGESHLSVSPVIEVREAKNLNRLLDAFTAQ